MHFEPESRKTRLRLNTRGSMVEMLDDLQIEKLEGRLTDYRLASRHKYDIEQEILKQYERLLESYRRLKSDFEEEREAREKYKKLAREQEKNPFVLLLLDLDGYIFNDDLIKAGKDGGAEAARLLKASVKDAIRGLGEDTERCRIMVRGYTNLQGLSITSAKAGLVGLEARSLGPFVSSFCRAEDTFDIVDAGDTKEGADIKIREMFRLFVESGQCRHIYFGACHDSSYLPLLTPWKEKTEKITLIRTSAFQPEFLKLGLDVLDLPTVFRSRPITTGLASSPAHTKAGLAKTSPTAKSASPQKVSNGVKKPCYYFQQGKCRNGDGCKFGHVAKEPSTPEPTNNHHKNTLSDNWRNGHSTDSSNSPTKQESYNQNKARHVAGSLPCDSPTNAGLIPINCDDERLDTYIAAPTTEQWDHFNRRIGERKLCNRFHLMSNCPDQENCQYDHQPIDMDIFQTLKFVARSHPCGRLGACRVRSCVNGHICQRDGCWGGSGCKFKHRMHFTDPVPAKWVKPMEEAFSDHNLDLEDTDSFFKTPNSTVNSISAVGKFQTFPW